MIAHLRSRPLESAFLALLVFSVFWRGGKSVDATWIAALMMGALFLLSWILDRYSHESRSERLQEGSCPSWIRVIALSIIGWTILSYVTSQTKNYGLDEVLRTTFYILTFLWVVRLRERGKSAWLEEQLPRVLGVTALAASLIGIVVYLFQPVSRFTGTFFDTRYDTNYWPNAWAEFLLLALPLAGLCLLTAQKKSRPQWVWGMMLLLASLYLSYSRGGMLAFVGEGVLLLCVLGIQAARSLPLRRKLRSTWKSMLLSVILILGCAALLVFCFNTLRAVRYDVESIGNKITFTSSEGMSSVDERAQFWQQAIELTRGHPLVGWGPYSFRFIQPQMMTSVLATSDHPHNAFLKMAVERGWPAAVLFAMLFASILLLYIRRLFSAHQPSMLQTAAFLGVSGVLAHVMIDYNPQFTGIGLPLFALLGILAPMKLAGERGASFLRWKTRRRLDDLSALVALALLVITVWEGLFLVTSSLGRHTADHDRALGWFQRSHSELYSRDLYLAEASLHMIKNQTGAALTSLDTYQMRNPHDARAWRMRGEILLGTHSGSGAVAAFEEAYRRGKYTDIGIVRLLLQAYEGGDPPAVKSHKLEFDALFMDFSDAILANIHFIALSQNVEELLKVSRLLSIAFPTDAPRYTSIAREAVNHAKKERSATTSRPPGLLW